MKPPAASAPFSRKRRSYGLLLLVLSCTIFTSGCIGNLFQNDRVVVPHISPVPYAPALPRPVHTFLFGDGTVTITIPLNTSVYAGAKNAEKEVVIVGNVSEQDWVTQSYLGMIDDPAQDEFYRDLLSEFRKIRADSALDSDGYLELMSVFVQSVHYETTGENPPKFPIETFTDRSGDCDDKSLLLAGLLSREGYRVALLSFRNESHMAVGIACTGGEYRNSGYAYIETTNVTFAGIPPDGLAGGVVLASNPLVIPVGTGTTAYGSCNQTAFLRQTFVSTEDRFLALSKEAELRYAELESLASAKRIGAYNQRVSGYNSLVARLKKNAEVHNYILNHQYDRRGTYDWVKANLSGL